MTATSPGAVHELFAKLFSSGDLEGLMSLYEDGAVFFQRNGEQVKGKGAIRQIYTELLATRGRMDLRVQKIMQAEDLALVFSSWQLRETSSSAESIRSGQTSDVMRRQSDGSWLLMIDVPYGAEVES